MWEVGSYKASHDMMAWVVEIYRRVLDDTHPDRQTAETWLEIFESELANGNAGQVPELL
jgi:hypothetical protein